MTGVRNAARLMVEIAGKQEGLRMLRTIARVVALEVSR